jgi:hypothetical protein
MAKDIVCDGVAISDHRLDDINHIYDELNQNYQG